MRQLYTLGLPGGTGREQHIHHIVGRLSGRLRRSIFGEVGSQGVVKQNTGDPLIRVGQRVRIVQHHSSVGALKDAAPARGGLVRTQRHPRRTRRQHAQQRGELTRSFSDANTHNIPRCYAVFA